MLADYLSLVAKSVKHDPWNLEIDVEEAIDFTFKNLRDFTLPKGNIFIAQKANQSVGTASIKNTPHDC